MYYRRRSRPRLPSARLTWTDCGGGQAGRQAAAAAALPWSQFVGMWGRLHERVSCSRPRPAGMPADLVGMICMETVSGVFDVLH